VSPRRLLATARLDLLHNLRRPLFWIWLLILVLTSWGLSTGDMRIQSGDSDVGGLKTHITSEFALALIFAALVPLFHAFFIAVAAGMSVLRDEELAVGEVLHATPLKPSEYVWGKFLAALISFVAMLAVHGALAAFFNHLVTGASQADYVGPFLLANYLRPALVFGLPLVVFLAGTSFYVGSRFRRPILVFFLPVAMLFLCAFFLWSWSPSWLPHAYNRLLMLVDPGGFRWLMETWLDTDRGAAFYNTQAIPYDTPFLVSRALFVLLGIVPVWLAARHFAKNLRGVQRRVSGATLPEPTPTETAPVTPAALGALGMRSKRPGFLRGLLAITRVEFRELLASPGLYLFVPLIVLETVVNTLFMNGPFETPVLLTSGVLAVGGVGWLAALVCLLLLFYTVESLRREEGTALAQIHHATPVRTSSILFGKALANSLVGVVVIGLTMLTDLIILVARGEAPADPIPFLLVWCVLLLPTFLAWSSFVALLYSLVRNRYTTYALALGAFMWTSYQDETGGLSWVWNWPLWNALQWSDMGVFELIRGELLLNRIMVVVVAVLFTVATVQFFGRRQRDATNTLLRLRPKPVARRALLLAPLWVPVLVLGGILDARIDSGFQGEELEKATHDYWRKNVATWLDAPEPDLVGADFELELFPERRAFEVRGTFRLRNETDEALAVLPLTRGFGWRRPDSLPPPEEGEGDGPLWTFAGQEHEPEDAAGLILFRPEEPLATGEEVEIGFHHSGEVPFGATRGGGGAGQFIVPGGVVLHSFSPSFVPVIGFQEGIGVDEDNAWDPKQYDESFFEGDTPSLFGTAGRPYPVRSKVTAPAEYTINCVGTLTSDEVVDGRRTVVWETDEPVRFFNVVAGRWAVARGEQGTALYYHPEHDYNVPAMVEALDAAREHYSRWFHPYPWNELKISQFPGLGAYAQGFPTNITFSEAIGFLTEDEEDVADAPFLVTAHESAHQWWGNMLCPGRGPGGNLLSEGMAHFSTLLLFEEVRGLEARIEFARRIEDQYGDQRVADSERALVWITGDRPGDTTVTYDKAGWVFWMLSNQIGRERCLEGMSSFMTHYLHDRDHPVLQDFLAHMRPFAPDEEAYDAFVEQWFHEVVLPEFRLEEVQRVESAGGWEVTLNLTNAGTGDVTVEVAAVRGERFPDEDAEDPEPYHEARTSVSLGAEETQEIRIECDFEPQRVVVDPDALVLMLRRQKAEHDLEAKKTGVSFL